MVCPLKVLQAINGKPYRIEVPRAHRKRLERMFLRAVAESSTRDGIDEMVRESGEVAHELIEGFRLTMEARFFLDGRMIDNNWLTMRSSGEKEHRMWLTDHGRAYLAKLEEELGNDAPADEEPTGW